MKFKKLKPEKYNLDKAEKIKDKIYYVIKEMKDLEFEYNKEIKSLSVEIELLPEGKIKEKNEKIKKLKKDLSEKIENLIEKFKNKLPVFIVIEEDYFPIKSEELIKVYSIISNRVFRKENILFMTKENLFEIVIYLDFCETRNYFDKTIFDKIINVIFLKVEKDLQFKDELEKFCNIKFIN